MQGMNPRWKAYLNKCEANGEKPKNHAFQVFIMKHMNKFKEANDIKEYSRLTEEEHQRFDEFLFDKYPTMGAD